MITRFIPSLNEFKSTAAEKRNMETETSTWKPVLLPHKTKYFPAFLIEELQDLVTLYVVQGTSVHEGELLITRKNDILLSSVSLEEFLRFSKQYGKGYLPWVKKSGMVPQLSRSPD
jgi:hypothetical protein